MKFNHISFPSSDVKATADFFVRHLGCALEYIGADAAVLKRAGFDIVIEAKDHTVVWPHNFHLGFELPSVDELSELYQHLLAQGVIMQTGLFQQERGSRFFCAGPGGLLFEMNTRADAHERYRSSFERQARADAVK